MTRALVPLTMSTVSDLPLPARTCVTWELPEGAADEMDEFGKVFEKDVWLSGVMLTWGSCGLVATVDDQAVGYALFAPPTAVPGSTRFPSGPVSPDAVLLTGVQILPEFRGQGLARYLIVGVLNALTRRGVRAVEAFGSESTKSPRFGKEPLPCVLPAEFLRVVGFTDVKVHRRYPRLRVELGSGIQWKAQVESALEKLTTEIFVPTHKDRTLVGVGMS